MKIDKYIFKLSAVAVIVIVMLCTAPVMEFFGFDTGVTAHAARFGDFTYKVIDGEAIITSHKEGYYTEITIPDNIWGYPVTTLGEDAFDYCITETFTMSKNVKQISEDTFSGCLALEYEVASGNSYFSADKNGVLYNKKKTVLYRYPIYNESTTFVVPSTVEEIYDHAFEYAYFLKNIELPESVTKIGYAAFSDCYFLYNINLPEGIKSIEGLAFYNCLYLSYIEIPRNCESIGKYAFNTCVSLQNVTIPGSVQSVGEEAFGNCFFMDNVKIYSDNIVIGEKAFCLEEFSLDKDYIDDFCVAWAAYCLSSAEGDKIEAEGYKYEANEFITSNGDFVPQGTIYCFKGSTAEAYAKNNNINYSLFTGVSNGHTYKEEREEATCADEGYVYTWCICGCDYEKYEAIPLKEHSYKTSTTKATMSKNGEVVKSCKSCGEVKSSKTIYKISSLKLSATSYTYNGKVKTPSVVVKDSKGNTLKKDTDYTVKYSSGRKAVGVYKVKITFIDKYSGTQTLSFKIVLGKVTGIRSEKSGNKTIVSWNKVTGATGYVVYEYSKSAGKYVKLGTISKNSFSGKYKGEKVAFKIRAYYVDKNGKTHYGAYSDRTTVLK